MVISASEMLIEFQIHIQKFFPKSLKKLIQTNLRYEKKIEVKEIGKLGVPRDASIITRQEP